MKRSKNTKGHLWDLFTKIFRKFKPNFLKENWSLERQLFQAEMESLINEFNGYQEFGAGYFNQKKAQVWLS